MEGNDSCAVICEVTKASDEPKDSFVGKAQAKTEPRWPIYTSAWEQPTLISMVNLCD